MNSDISTYPSIDLQFRLKIRFMLNRLMRFAASSFSDTADNTVSIEQEFKELIKRENAVISKICFSYAGSVAEFDDLRQDALINIWRGMNRYRGDSSHRTWVYRVTVNSCLSTIRKQNRHQHEKLDSLYGLIDSDESDRESIELIHRIINSLGVKEKAIIMMWLDELTYDEIASAMGMNRNTVATHIHRIKGKITEKFNKEENV